MYKVFNVRRFNNYDCPRVSIKIGLFTSFKLYFPSTLYEHRSFIRIFIPGRRNDNFFFLQKYERNSSSLGSARIFRKLERTRKRKSWRGIESFGGQKWNFDRVFTQTPVKFIGLAGSNYDAAPPKVSDETLTQSREVKYAVTKI